MNNDLISREALKKALKTEFKDHLLYLPIAFKELIDNAPTVKPILKLEDITEDDVKRFAMIWQRATSKGLILETDRPRGKWEVPFMSEGRKFHKCTHCHISSMVILFDNFCPNCGADMREGEADD